MGFFSRNGANGRELADALDAWKRCEARPESLSPQARARILENAFDQSGRVSLGPIASLFLPARRMMAVGLAPALLLAAALALGIPWRGPADSSEGAPLMLHAEKRGEVVVFFIANGGRPHVVERSTFADGRAVADRLNTSGGQFRDSLGSGPDIVYYRID
jgi:hypothetical protein